MPKPTPPETNVFAVLRRSTSRVVEAALTRRKAITAFASKEGIGYSDVLMDRDILVGTASARLAAALLDGSSRAPFARELNGGIVSEQEWAEAAVMDQTEVRLVASRGETSVHVVTFRAGLMRLALPGYAIEGAIVVVDGPDFDIEFHHDGAVVTVRSDALPEGRPTVDACERPEVAAFILLSWWAWSRARSKAAAH